MRFTHFFLASLTALLCILSQPILAQFSPGIPLSQNIPTATQLWQQGREAYENSQFAESVKIWQQAAQSYQSQGDRLNQAMVLSNLALAHQELGQLSEASEAIGKALKILETAPDTPDRRRIFAQVLNTQGSWQMAQGQATAAMTTLQQAADTYKQVGDQAGVIRSLLNQAQILRVLGLYRRALTTLTEVKQSLQTQPDSPLKATGLRHLGNNLRLIGDLSESQKVLEQSLAIAQKLPSSPDIAAALLSLGNTARSSPATETALKYYQQAAATASSPKIKIQAQLNQLSLIVAGENKDKYLSLVQPLTQQIQTQLTDLPPSRVAVYARINFAQSLMKLGNEERLLRNEQPFSCPIAPAVVRHERQGCTTNNKQQIAQILAIAIQQAQTLGDSRAQAYALVSLGGLYEQTGQWLEAQKLTQQSLVLAQAFNASEIAYRSSWQLGRLLKVTGDLKGAIAAYTEAVNTLKSLRSDLAAINSEVQFSFREGVEPVYRELVGLLLQHPASSSSPLGGGTQGGQGEITSQERLEIARKVIESLQLAELDNFFRSACLNTKPVQIDAVDQKAAVIYPIILADRLEIILSLPNQGLHRYTTSLPKDEIESTLRQLRAQLPNPTSQRFLPLSQQIYNWLIRPIETDLSKSEVKTLVFVLDGSLRNVPMAVLHDGKQYLTQKYGIALTPGLELLEPKPLAILKLKILKAGLSEARQGFDALPAVKMELEQIQSQIPGKVLLNQEFTKTAIQKAIHTVSFQVVHLATHGQFSSKAEETYILTWDDRINVNELNNLLQKTDLRQSTPIELLVLSACETAKGDNRAALGIAGVAVKAGARSILATLWKVNDQATAVLMVRFYQELTKPGVTKAEALHRAQLSILQDRQYGEHPYYWASFVLVGNWL